MHSLLRPFFLLILLILLQIGIPLAPAQNIELPPTWYNEARVQVHTRYPPFRFLGRTPEKEQQFYDFSEQMERLGIKTYTRWVQSRDGLSIYPRPKYGDALPATKEQRDIAQKLFADAESRGQTIIGYYNHFLDTWAAETHPEWVAQDREGKPQGRKLFGTDVFAPWVSLANPDYRSHLISRLKELQTRGMQGVYFDMTHVPKTGDFSPAATTLYQQLNNKNLQHASEAEILEFRQQIMRLFFNQVQEELSQKDADYLMLISHNRLSLDVLRQSGGVVKSEPHFTKKLGGLPSMVTLLMDVGGTGSAPHLWMRSMNPVDPPRIFSQYFAYGAVLNMDFFEGTEAEIPEKTRPELEPLLNLGKQMSPAMRQAAPLRLARVLLDGNLRLNENEAQADKAFALFNELNQAHIPSGYLSYTQLAQEGLDQHCQVLLIPDFKQTDFAKNQPQAHAKALALKQAGIQVLYADDLRGDWVSILKARIPLKLESKNGKLNQDLVLFVDQPTQSLIIHLVAPAKQQLILSIDKIWAEKQGLNLQAPLKDQISQKTTQAQAAGQNWQLEIPQAEKGTFLRQLIIPKNPATR